MMSRSECRIDNLTVRVTDWNGEVVFLHEIIAGAADQSYGVQVAKLAGLPAKVVARAKHCSRSSRRPTASAAATGLLPICLCFQLRPALILDSRAWPAIDLPELDPLREALDAIDPDELSPRRAIDGAVSPEAYPRGPGNDFRRALPSRPLNRTKFKFSAKAARFLTPFHLF